MYVSYIRAKVSCEIGCVVYMKYLSVNIVVTICFSKKVVMISCNLTSIVITLM